MNRLSVIDKANNEVIDRIFRSKVLLIGIEKAADVVEKMKGKTILHSGPPIEWNKMCETMQSAICGAIVYEGWATSLDGAHSLASKGEIEFNSAHSYSALGPMAGIISPSMPVFVVKNEPYGNRAYITINEGLGKTLRFGANDEAVIKRLKWIENTLHPILKAALTSCGQIDLTSMLARGIQRGDECHNRNKATTSLFIRHVAPWMVRTPFAKDDIADALAFMDSNDHFFLNLSMGVSKATMDQVVDIPHSTVVSCIATNGVEIGIKVAGLGDRWIKGPAGYAKGNYFEPYTEKDANRVMGDSYVSEPAGIGGFAMAAAPGISSFIGISVQEAIDYSMQMYIITIAEHNQYKIPLLNFRGTPLGIDIRKVLHTGILPIINTGIAHKKAGIGQIGAGTTVPPMSCFEKASQDMDLT